MGRNWHAYSYSTVHGYTHSRTNVHMKTISQEGRSPSLALPICCGRTIGMGKLLSVIVVFCRYCQLR